MSEYRRWYVPGGTYFFTVVTYRRRLLFRDAAARQLLGDVMREVVAERPVQTIATVLMYDHLHCVWTLPPDDEDYSRRWKEIKSRFTERWLAAGGKELPVTSSMRRRGRRGVWQPRFWEHTVRDEDDLEAHFDYVHYNPTKHGYAKRPWDWPWSTFRQYVDAGDYDRDWGRTEPPNLNGLDFE